MKEELVRVINTKLDNIKVNIESLMELNGKIDDENKKLLYIDNILKIFKNESDYNILNFTKLSKEKFDNVTELLGDSVQEMFKTSSCNYDGLVYLINGINNGVSLSLTLEQENAINYLLQGLEGKSEEYEATIDGLLLVKDHFNITDIDLLKDKQNHYESMLNKMENNDYIDDIDDVMEAISFSKVDSSKTIDLLTYLLSYNAGVYTEKGNKGLSEEVRGELPEEQYVEEPVNVENDIEEAIDNTENDEANDEKSIESDNSDVTGYGEFHFPEFENIETVENKVTDDIIMPNVELSKEDEEENMFIPPEVSIENEKVEPLPIVEPLPMPEVGNDFISPMDMFNTSGMVEKKDDESIELSLEKKEDDIPQKEESETISTREIQRLFKEFDITKIDNYNDLLTGNIENYRKVLTFLKSNNLINEISKNERLLIEILICSTDEDLSDIINIIKNELSVDEDDYKMTLKIAIETIPSIFVREGGNYENFVRNVKMFKEIGINLVSLFDFSKEVFVANHNNLMNNYEIVKNYNINLDYKNVKYMLMLHNIGEKIDYFVESIYPDRTKNNEKFDGITYINTHPNKLNVVDSNMIKKLRFSSENSKKVFGNKPNSLAGEISNPKVNTLEISNEYLNRFFDNKFDSLTNDEVREYQKLCLNSSNIGNYTDELSMLEKYHNGLRYTIDNVNISYNKVVRAYNTLRSYGVDVKKALLFAVCYNLVITNDEYNMIKETLERDGE